MSQQRRMPLLEAGYAVGDITPDRPITLSGFVARCEVPFERVADRLAVKVLHLRQGGLGVVVITFDLLGLGLEILELIHDAIDRLNPCLPRERRILHCTHTHSAPATIRLIGCGRFDADYWRKVADAAAKAVADALAATGPCELDSASLFLPGMNYNRRKVLDDGRVVMAMRPDRPVVSEGPAWEEFLFLRLRSSQGSSLAGVLLWAAHPCTVCSQDVSGDYPAVLCLELERRFGMPFVLWQGACGNLNPPFRDLSYSEMTGNVARILAGLPASLRWAPEPAARLALVHRPVPLSYGPRPPREALGAFAAGMRGIQATGSGPALEMATLANILNIAPGDRPDPDLLCHLAGAMAEWASEQEAAYGASPDALSVPCAMLALGLFRFFFIGAEVFTETAMAALGLAPRKKVRIVGYASPLAGYLPPDGALDDGGYESTFAYRFYGHPAAFARGSEERLLRVIKALLEEPHNRRPKSKRRVSKQKLNV